MAESDSQGSGLFSGPYRLQDTAAKYMSPFKETSCKRAKREEDTRDKEARDRTRSDGVSMPALLAHRFTAVKTSHETVRKANT